MPICASDNLVIAGNNCRDLDFNIKFEQSILSILPNVLFICTILLRYTYNVYQSSKEQERASFRNHSILFRRWDILVSFKVIFGLLLIAADAATVAEMTMVNELKPIITTKVAYGIQLISSISLLANAAFEHYVTMSPSTVNILFAIFRTLTGACQLRTFGLIDLQDSNRPAFIALALSTGGALAVTLVESFEKRWLLDEDHRNAPRRETASIVTKPFFFHLVSLLRNGYTKKLALSDLESVPSRYLGEASSQLLATQLNRYDHTKKGYLIRASFSAFRSDFLRPILPKLLLMLGSFGQLFLVQDMTRFVENIETSETRGWALVGGFVLIYTIIPVSTYLYGEELAGLQVRYRAALVEAIYAKTLKLSAFVARDIGQGAASTYMSVDVQQVIGGVNTIYEVTIASLAILLSCVMLWFQAKWAMFAAMLTMLMFLAVTTAYSKPTGNAQKAWLDAIDIRTKLLSSIFHQLRPIKLGAYESIFEAKVHALKSEEVKRYKLYMWTILRAATIANVAGNFSTLACIGTYALMQSRGVGTELGPLNASRIFTIVATILLLDGPLNTVGQSLPTILASIVSVRRIREFLILEEKGFRCEDTCNTTPQQSAHYAHGKVESTEEQSTASQKCLPAISVRDGSFSWDRETVILKDINLDIRPGKLHVVIGPVGSGKTTLLMSLLEETFLINGWLQGTTERVALTSQNPLIIPGTIESNITFDQPLDREFFDKVVSACGLTADLQHLTKGKNSKLGERGVTLSGGQRQRIALARAVYAMTNIVFLDDVFSALDGITEAFVFESLFGAEGLLRGKTVILVTHCLRHLLEADQIVMMAHGSISHVGTFAELKDAGAIDEIEDAIFSNPSLHPPAKKNVHIPVLEDDAEEQDEEQGNLSMKSRWLAYRFFAQALGPVTITIYFVLSFLLNGVVVGTQGYLKEFATSSSEQLGGWLGGFAALNVAWFAIQAVLNAYTSFHTVGVTSHWMHQSELRGILHTTFDYLQQTPVGKILNRFSLDMQQADRFVPTMTSNVLWFSLRFVGSVVFFILATPWLGVALVVIIPAYFVLLRVYLSTSTQLQHLESGSRSPIYTLFSTTLSGLQSIRSYRAQQYFVQQNRTMLDSSLTPNFHRFETLVFLRTVLNWLTSTLGIGMSILAVVLRHKSSAALLGVALSQLVNFGQFLSWYLNSYTQLENALVSVKRIQEFAALPDEESNPRGAPRDQSLQVSGEIEFCNFSMKYGNELPLALENLSFSVMPGEKIGICGRTGSGKSSMVLALFRAIQQRLVSGSILMDGRDTATMTLKELRSSMSIVTQESFLWRGTLRENIDVEGKFGDEKIWAVLDAVGMKKAVSEVEGKLDEELADEQSFSTGQRQLLCIARVLLSDRKIVVMDESTSSMDHLTDERIRTVIATQMKGVTVFSIAHRISSIVEYDKILLLDHGRVAEFDSPAALLSRPDSHFSRLAATQGIQSKPPSESMRGNEEAGP